jgi:hypothetical protein
MRYPSLFLPLTQRCPGGDRPRRLPSICGRGGRLLALLATSGLLAVSGVVAGTAVPALADSFFVELAASPTTLPVGGTTTLTATTGADVGPTPWFIDIFDTTTGLPVMFCGSGTTCSTTVSETTATTQTFVAYVASTGPSAPPPNIQGTSNTSYVTWTNSGMQVTLRGPEVDNIPADGPATFTAVTNINVGPTPWVIEIYDETAGTLLGYCSTGTSCSMHTEPSVNGDYLIAFIATYIQLVSQHYPPPLSTLQASSNVILSRGFYG